MMKKKKIKIIGIIVAFLISSLTSFTISYVNYSNQGISPSKKIKSKTNDLYAAGDTYATVNPRVQNLEGVEIPEGANLNSYTTVGTYYAGSSSRAASLSNKPVGVAFTMFVLPSVTTQVVVTYNGSIYKRYYSGGSWSTWQVFSPDSTYKRILSIQDKTTTTSSTLANYGTANVTATFSSVSGATEYYAIPTTCTYGVPTSVSISNTTVTVGVLNASGASHTVSCALKILAVK